MADEDALFAEFMGEIKSAVAQSAPQIAEDEGDTVSESASVGEADEGEGARGGDNAKRKGSSSEASRSSPVKKPKFMGKLVAAALPMKAGAAASSAPPPKTIASRQAVTKAVAGSASAAAAAAAGGAAGKANGSSAATSDAAPSGKEAENMEKAAAVAAIHHKITTYHEASIPPHAGSGLSAIGRRMPKQSDPQNGRSSKKNIMDAMRRVILLSSVRRVQERAFVQSTVEQQRQGEGCIGEDGYASSSASGLSTLSPSGHWKLAVRTAAKNARSGKHGAELSASTDTSYQVEDPWQQVSSLTPFLALQKLLATIRNNCDSTVDNESGNWGALGAGDTLVAAFGQCRSGDGFVGDGGGQGDCCGEAGGAAAPTLDPSDSRVAQRRTDNDSIGGGVSMGNLQKIDLSLAGLREKASLSLPSSSPTRKSVAIARIDAILLALIEDGFLADGGGGGVCKGGWGGSSPKLTHSEVETVIAYVDMDQSGEIDPTELEVAISAAKQGKMADESLTRCMLKIDDELHVRQLQIRDLFCMLDADGSGTLSRPELAEGLGTLCGQDRVTIIQRRQALRQRQVEQRARAERRRANAVGFLTNTESIPEEILQDRDFFAAKGTDKDAFLDLVQRVSDAAGGDDDSCADCSGGYRRRQSSESPPLHQTATIGGLKANDAQLVQLKEMRLSRIEAANTMARGQPDGTGGNRKCKARGRATTITEVATAVAKSTMRLRSHGPAAHVAARRRLCSSLTAAATAGSASRRPGGQVEAPFPAGLPRPWTGEDVVERQKGYNLHDRYLRIYLQRRFERERLPNLFAARTQSLLHDYAVKDAFTMAKKQAMHVPRFI